MPGRPSAAGSSKVACQNIVASSGPSVDYFLTVAAMTRLPIDPARCQLGGIVEFSN